MLNVILYRDRDLENKNRGTCVVCFQKIVDAVYWRCPHSVCGGVDGPGRMCSDCHVKVVAKNKCVTCNRRLQDNPITDPALLEYAVKVEADDASSFLYASVLNLSQTHLDEVIEFSRHSAAVVHFLVECAKEAWHLYPLDSIKKLYQHLETAIMSRWTKYSIQNYGRHKFVDMIKKRPAWLLETASWIIKWRNDRKCIEWVIFDASDYKRRLEFEAALLDVCETKEEFMILRDLAINEDNYEFLHVDVIALYIRTIVPGKEWVMHHFLDVVGNPREWEKDLPCFVDKFKYEPMYAWLGKLGNVVLHAPFNVEWARKYHLAPLFYACHRKGVYTVTGDNKFRGFSSALGNDYGDVSVPVDDLAMYVDLSSDFERNDWLSMPDLKTVDAKEGTLVVEICDEPESVNFYVGDVQLVIVGIPYFKIVQFDQLRVRRIRNSKRKCHLVE